MIEATHFLTLTCKLRIHTFSFSSLNPEAHGSKQRLCFMTGYLAPSVGHRAAEYSESSGCPSLEWKNASEQVLQFHGFCVKCLKVNMTYTIWHLLLSFVSPLHWWEDALLPVNGYRCRCCMCLSICLSGEERDSIHTGSSWRPPLPTSIVTSFEARFIFS